MNALLIVAHGSRQKDANRFLEALSAEIAAEADDKFAMVQCTFLEFNGPFAGESIADLVSKGAQHIVVFPFFLSAGRHVAIDLPNLIGQAETKYPQVVFEIATFLGGIKGLKNIILEAVQMHNG
ncbi:MAG: CbiX/SirB N-terminal domain-containing protein [SAR324 cluster bacterium]|nr:CbiX/SirB N-terminal domain-containing protein [SAR324 cluster bacterium]